MMKRFVVLGLKILGGLLVTLIVLLVSATLILNSRSFQQKMLAHLIASMSISSSLKSDYMAWMLKTASIDRCLRWSD